MTSYIDVMRPSVPQKCLVSQEDFDRVTFAISLFLAVGIVVSYLPQVHLDTRPLTVALPHHPTQEQRGHQSILSPSRRNKQFLCVPQHSHSAKGYPRVLSLHCTLPRENTDHRPSGAVLYSRWE